MVSFSASETQAGWAGVPSHARQPGDVSWWYARFRCARRANPEMVGHAPAQAHLNGSSWGQEGDIHVHARQCGMHLCRGSNEGALEPATERCRSGYYESQRSPGCL